VKVSEETQQNQFCKETENIQENKLKERKRLYIDLLFRFTDLTYQIERRGLMKEKLFLWHFLPISLKSAGVKRGVVF
jgi:hypothetical protein